MLDKANQMHLDIVSIFNQHNICEVDLIEGVKSGKSNSTFIINNIYVIKICDRPYKQRHLKKEAYLNKLLKGYIPLPETIVYDESLEFCNFPYLISKIINGRQLSNTWNLLSDEQKLSIFTEYIVNVKKLHNFNLDKLDYSFGFDKGVIWREYVLNAITAFMDLAKKINRLSPEIENAINLFCKKYQSSLTQEKIALVNFDMHFDHVIENDGKLEGLIDFGNTDVASIDYMLHKIYQTNNKKNIDNRLVFGWIKNLYPEVMNFENLEERIKFYLIMDNLFVLAFMTEVPANFIYEDIMVDLKRRNFIL